VRRQLRLAESAGYPCAGLPSSAVYILNEETNECLHASNTESIPAGAPNPVNFEVYRLPLRDGDDKTDLWLLGDLSTGKSLTSEAFGRVLHASNTLVTPQGHKFLYTCAPNNTDHAEEFLIVPSGSVPDDFRFTGYFRLASVRTNLRATYGVDLTPGAGRGCIRKQEGPGSTSIDRV
jgi:hypothetical protein